MVVVVVVGDMEAEVEADTVGDGAAEAAAAGAAEAVVAIDGAAAAADAAGMTMPGTTERIACPLRVMILLVFSVCCRTRPVRFCNR